MADKNSGPAEAVQGIVEGIFGRAKVIIGALIGRNDMIKEGHAQLDKAEAQRDAAKKEAKAEKKVAKEKEKISKEEKKIGKLQEKEEQKAGGAADQQSDEESE